MKVVLPLAVVALIVLGVALVAWILTRSDKARQNRRARERHEMFLDHLFATCLDSADVDPFARVVADEIRNYLTASSTPRKVTR